MFGYIVRRLVSAFLVVVLTSMIVFVLFFKGPSNPAQPLCDLNGKCTPEKLALLTEQLGFNDPMVQQYGIYVGGLFHDREIDFGATYHCDAPCLGISYRTRGEVTAGAAPEVAGHASPSRSAALDHLPDPRRAASAPSPPANAAPRSTAGWSPSASSSRPSPTT